MQIMNIELESMAIEMPVVAGHPNREAFRGVLTVVDVPSDGSPSGARGHRVILSRKAAEAALPSLLGMALDYSLAFDRHDSRRKVGMITRADIVGKKLEVGGHLFAKDFPEIVQEIAKGAGPSAWKKEGQMESAGDGELGMSYEIADARIADVRATVWTLTQVTFTGAAILRRSKAAYRNTWIALE